MASYRILCFTLLLSSFTFYLGIVDGTITKSMHLNWGPRLSTIQGDSLQLALDPRSGSGAQTKKAFLFGSLEMMIKLVPGNSAGTVTAYYLSSQGEKHDEIDFEFLGNVSGQPYTVHTNVFTQGIGGREQQFSLWFDPTADYHKYTIHWNPNMIVWYVDEVPLRVFRNYENQGIGYPNQQGMRVYSSIWDADDWATRGGLDKIDWNRSPFIAGFKNFRARACKWGGLPSITKCASPGNWWTAPVHRRLSNAKKGQMDWIRKTHMVYDYCQDTNRFKGMSMPPECSLPQF